VARLTLFTIPKPFAGHEGTIQRNALGSWRALGDDIEIVVFGDEEGAAEAAAEVGALHVPGIARTPLGTPLVSEAFAETAARAHAGLLCFANTDMILTSSLLTAVSRLKGRRALLVGRRTDLDIAHALEFGAAWEEELAAAARDGGEIGHATQIDYMVFPRDVPWEMPPFAVGRPGWDNWLLYRARRLGLDLVDLTPVVLAVHQRHGYGHVPGSRGEWAGPEGDENLRLMERDGAVYTLMDATHILTPQGLRRALEGPYLRRRARRHPVLRHAFRGLDGLRRRRRSR
jgi:hypothetical protein